MTTTVNTEKEAALDSKLDGWVGKEIAPGFRYNGRQFIAKEDQSLQCDLMISVEGEYGCEENRALILDGIDSTFEWLDGLGLLDGSVDFTINESPV